MPTHGLLHFAEPHAGCLRRYSAERRPRTSFAAASFLSCSACAAALASAISFCASARASASAFSAAACRSSSSFVLSCEAPGRL